MIALLISNFWMLIVYAAVVIAVAWLARQTNPDWSPVKIAFWAGAALPLAGFVVLLGMFLLMMVSRPSGGAVRYEGNLFGLALALGGGMLCLVLAAIGFAAAWLFMLWRSRR